MKTQIHFLLPRLVIGLSVVALGSVTLAKCLAKQAPGVSTSIDPEDEAEARQLLVQNCLMCHSEELIATQRLTSKQWTAEVEKMVGWGSPLPVDKKESLVSYLFALYPDKAPRPATVLASVDELLASHQPDPMGTAALLPRGDASRGAALYSEHCAKCHGAEAKGGDLGTSLVERSILLREADYTEILRKGRHRMPGFATILKPEQEADLLAWLKGRR